MAKRTVRRCGTHSRIHTTKVRMYIGVSSSSSLAVIPLKVEWGYGHRYICICHLCSVNLSRSLICLKSPCLPPTRRDYTCLIAKLVQFHIIHADSWSRRHSGSSPLAELFIWQGPRRVGSSEELYGLANKGNTASPGGRFTRLLRGFSSSRLKSCCALKSKVERISWHN